MTKNKFTKDIRYPGRTCGVIVLLTCFLGMAYVTHAQDPHFSQYFASPFTLNPALIGKDVVDWRASLHYRSQWWGGSTQPLTTATATIEKNLLNNPSGKDQLGLGLMMLSDQSNGGLLKNNFFAAGLAYHNALDAEGRQLLSGGISVNYSNRLLDANKFEFQSQLGSLGFQRSLPANDVVNIVQSHYVDVNIGVHFSARTDKNNFYIGVSLFHASRPKEGFLIDQSQYSVSPRLSTQLSYGFKTGEKSALQLSMLTDHQGINHIYTIGAMCQHSLHNERQEKINFGVWNRFNDAVYPYISFETKSWVFGISYDAVISDIKNYYNSVQSMEVSFVWQFAGKKREGSGEQIRHVLYY